MKSQDDLKKMSVKDLKAIAGAIGINAAAMKKNEVIDALLSAGTPDEDAPENNKKPAEKEGEGAQKRGRGKAAPKAEAAEEAAETEANSDAVQPEKKRGRKKKETATAPEKTETPAAETKPAEPVKEIPKKPAIDPNKARIRNFQNEQRGNSFGGNTFGNNPFGRDFTPNYERKSNYNPFGGPQFTDKRQNGFDAQNQRQNGTRQQQTRQFDQRNQNERRFANDQRFGGEKQRQKTFFERAQDFSDDITAREEGRTNEREEVVQETPAEPEVREVPKTEDDKEFDCYGILEINQNGYGFLRAETLYPGAKDIFVPPPLIRRHQLRTGDMITGKAKVQSKEFNAQFALSCVKEINGFIPENITSRPTFESLIPTYPDEQLILETTRGEYSTRIIDMFSPIGKGQRGLIVSPPKAGKTVLLKTIANALIRNYPDVHLIMLLIDERPEEVTDIKESVKAMVVASTFDEMTSRHIAVSEFCLEHAERMVEMGEDVVILMDSITRLARAYNQEVTPSGRSLSGGLDPAALYKPKKFFGAARNIKGGGSLTIIATALVDTGSRLDDVIYEEFKGTGNMELHLDRSLAERRIFPSIDITLSGTRKEELLLPRTTLDKIYALRRSFSNVNNAKDITEAVINNIAKTEDNKHFLNEIKIINYM